MAVNESTAEQQISDLPRITPQGNYFSGRLILSQKKVSTKNLRTIVWSAFWPVYGQQKTGI